MGKTISNAFKGITKAISQPINAGLNILKGKGNLGDFANIATLFAPGGDLARFSFGQDAFRKATLDSIGKNFLASRGIKITDFSNPANLTGSNFLKLAQSGNSFIPGGKFGSALKAHLDLVKMQQAGLATGGAGGTTGLSRSTGQQLASLSPSELDRIARKFRSDALAAADRTARIEGAKLVQQTGNPADAASLRLSLVNRATEAANNNRRDLFATHRAAIAQQRQAPAPQASATASAPSLSNAQLETLLDEFFRTIGAGPPKASTPPTIQTAFRQIVVEDSKTGVSRTEQNPFFDQTTTFSRAEAPPQVIETSAEVVILMNSKTGQMIRVLNPFKS